MLKRLFSHGLVLKLFFTILLFTGCGHGPVDEKPAPAALYETQVTGDWWDVADCTVRAMNANSVKSWPDGTTQGVWAERQAKRATIPVRRTSDMATLYTITLTSMGDNTAKAEIVSISHERSIYTDTVESEMKTAITGCGQTALTPLP